MKKLAMKQRIVLLDNLKQYFNASELRDICFALDIDYEALLGNGKEEKARELVLYLERRDQITTLLGICKRLRPQIEWELQDEANKLAEYSTASGILEKLAPFPIAPVFAHAQSSESYWTNRTLEVQALTNLWHDEQSRIVGIIGLGGVGKSSLARRWYDELLRQNIHFDGVFWWSFYYQSSLDEFLEGILAYLTNNQFWTTDIPSPWARTQQLLTLLKSGKFLVILDGLEVMQKAEDTGDDFGQMEDKAFRNLLELCADPDSYQGLILVTSRFPLTDLKTFENQSVTSLILDHFSEENGALYLKSRGIKGSLDTLRQLSNEYDGHVLSLSLLAGYLNEYFASDSKFADQIPHLATGQQSTVSRILQVYDSHLNHSQKAFMKLLSSIRRPFTHETLEELINKQEFIVANPLLATLASISRFELKQMLKNLENRGLIYLEQNHSGAWCYTSHLIIREYFYAQLSLDSKLQQQANLQLRNFSSMQSIPENPTRLEALAPLFDVIYYSCQAKRFDEAMTIFQSYGNGIRESLIYRFGAYEFFLSLIREFFPNRDLNAIPLVTGSKNQNVLLNLVSYCLRQIGRLVEAKKVFVQFLSNQVEPNEENERILTYLSLGVIDMDLGNLLEAQNTLSQVTEIVQNTQSTQNKIRAFASLGWVCFLRGEIELAQKYYDHANQIGYQTRGYGVFSVLGGQYATFLLMTGHIQDSKQYTEDNLARCIEKHWLEAMSYCKCLLGDIAVMENRLIEARDLYLEALEIGRNIGLQKEIAQALLGIAKIENIDGRSEESLPNLMASVEVVRSSQYRVVEIDILNYWSEVAMSLDNLSMAKEKAEQALEYSKQSTYAWGAGLALHNLGKVDFLLDRHISARVYLNEALSIRQKIKDPDAVQTQHLINLLKVEHSFP